MWAIFAVVTQAMEAVIRVIGADVLVSLAALAIVVLFLYVEGGPSSRPSH